MKSLFQAKGTLEYRGKWLVLIVDESIQKYYHFWVKKSLGLIKLNHPMHDTHVTVIAGKYEDCTQNSLWSKYQGQVIEFDYDHVVRDEGGYYWLEIYSEQLIHIRRELGLSDFPKHHFHITIANLKNC